MALRRPRTGEPRRGSASTLLIVGLANPGTKYEGSRHNIGGDAVRLLAQRRNATFQIERRQRAETCSFNSERGIVTLSIPTTFMNESGASLPPLMRRISITDPGTVLVVHDELDLEPGRLQLKVGGGLAGHNGLRSIADVLSSNEFPRLRIGIGKPERKEQVTDWVLRRPTGAMRESLLIDTNEAADALEAVIDFGLEEAQRRVNTARRD